MCQCICIYLLLLHKKNADTYHHDEDEPSFEYPQGDSIHTISDLLDLVEDIQGHQQPCIIIIAAYF